MIIMMGSKTNYMHTVPYQFLSDVFSGATIGISCLNQSQTQVQTTFSQQFFDISSNQSGNFVSIHQLEDARLVLEKIYHPVCIAICKYKYIRI